MKIACVIDSLGSGGAQRQLVELGKGFKERGHEVSFLVYHPQDFYWEELEKSNIKITYIEEPNYFKRLFKMRSFIRAGNYDGVLSFLEAANFICTVSGFPYRKWKLVVGERSANPNVLKSFKLRLYRMFHVFTDYVVANSQANLDIVKKVNPFIKTAKCKVIYNALSDSYLKMTTYSESDFKSSKIRLVIGASHRYLKNSLLFVKSFNRLNLELKNRFVVDWYGDNVEYPYFDGSFLETVKYIKDNNLQEFINFYPAVNNFNNKVIGSDVVGLFSQYEGLPNTICEAMILGKPVICSNISDMPKLLKENPMQIFKLEEVDSLVKTLEYYSRLSDKNLKLIGNSNFKKAKELFDRDKIIDEYLTLLAK